jgi:serine/threonine protein kinase
MVAASIITAILRAGLLTSGLSNGLAVNVESDVAQSAATKGRMMKKIMPSAPSSQEVRMRTTRDLGHHEDEVIGAFTVSDAGEVNDAGKVNAALESESGRQDMRYSSHFKNRESNNRQANIGAKVTEQVREQPSTRLEFQSTSEKSEPSRIADKEAVRGEGRRSLAERARAGVKPILFLVVCGIFGISLGWILPQCVLWFRRFNSRMSVDLNAAAGTQENTGALPRGDTAKRFSEEVMKQYKVGQLIGFGSFGVVHEVVSKKDGQSYAMKMVDLSASDMDEVELEAEILQLVKHESLTVGCMDLCHDACFFYIVMPIYRGGDLTEALSEYLATHGLIEEPTFMRIFSQMAEAITFVNSNNVLHCDIKPDNFLLVLRDITDANNRVALADFGLSAKLQPGQYLEEKCGTPCFFSPEVLARRYRFEFDSWALGLTAYILLTGSYAFRTEVEIEQWVQSNAEAPIPHEVSMETQHIFRRALERDGADRATAEELWGLAKKHPQMNPAASPTRALKRSATQQKQDQPRLVDGVKRMNSSEVRRVDWMVKQLANHAGKRSTTGSTFKPFSREVKGGMTKHYEWWPLDYCLKSGVPNASEENQSVRPVQLDSTPTATPQQVKVLTALLKSYGVDPDAFGKGDAKTLDELATDCRQGLCILSEDAKHLVRVIDVVVLHVEGPGGMFLVEKKVRKSLSPSPHHWERDGARLPAKKPNPWEDPHQTAERLLLDFGLEMSELYLEMDAMLFIVKDNSVAYPGIPSIYRRHELRVFLHDDLPHARLLQLGLSGGHGKRSSLAPGVVATKCSWVDQEGYDELIANQKQAKPATRTEMVRYISLQPAKLHGVSRQDVVEKLRRCGIDPNQYETDMLQSLADEATVGECDLVERENADGSLSLLRILRVVVVRVHGPTGGILVFVAKTMNDHKEEVKKLPAAKMRGMEHAFMAARRALVMQLGIDGEKVRFEHTAGGEVVEEKYEPKRYPGLKIVHNRSIVVAHLGEVGGSADEK